MAKLCFAFRCFDVFLKVVHPFSLLLERPLSCGLFGERHRCHEDHPRCFRGDVPPREPLLVSNRTMAQTCSLLYRRRGRDCIEGIPRTTSTFLSETWTWNQQSALPLYGRAC